MEENNFNTNSSPVKDQLQSVVVEELDNSPDNSGEITKELKIPKLPGPNKFHKYPKEWDKSLASYYTNLEVQDTMAQANFHKTALKKVRKALGKKCTHLIHVVDSNKIITFRAKLKIGANTKIVNVETYLQAKDIVAETYKNLNNVLLNEYRS